MMKSSSKKWVLKNKEVQNRLNDLTRLEPYHFSDCLNKACEEASQKQAKANSLITVEFGKEYSVGVFSQIYRCPFKDCFKVNPAVYNLTVGFIYDPEEYESKVLKDYYSNLLQKEEIELYGKDEDEEDFTALDILLGSEILVISVAPSSHHFNQILNTLHRMGESSSQKVMFVGSKLNLQKFPQVQEKVMKVSEGVGVCTPKNFLRTFYKVAEECAKHKHL